MKPLWVEVEWDDARAIPTLCGTKEYIVANAKPIHRYSCGYLLHWDQENLIMTRDYDPPDPLTDTTHEHADCAVIPSGWVREVTKLQRHRKVEREEKAVTDGETP